MKNALLFINGNPPKKLPNLEIYDMIACSDGAFHYLKNLNFPLEKLHFISGDFDSHDSEVLRQVQDDRNFQFQVFHTPDQDKTDFEKALEILLQKGAKSVDIFGGSGREMDHFLGNLSVAFQFKNEMHIRFFDEFSTYFFAEKKSILKDVKGKMISLYPFPSAGNVITKGLNWAIKNETLDMTSRIGTRNFAINNQVEISFKSGALIVFVGKNYS